MVTEKRKKEIIQMANEDARFAHECGHPDYDLFEYISDEAKEMYANEWEMTTEEVDIYIEAYCSFFNM